MEMISKVIGVLCICSFVMGILYNLGQFPTTEKVIKFVIAIYIIATIFNQSNDYEFSFDFDTNIEDIQIENQKNNNDNIRELILEKTKENLTEVVKIRLKEKNISYIDVCLHILEQDDNLIIETIQITGCDNSKTKNVYDCLQDLISEQTTVLLGE